MTSKECMLAALSGKIPPRFPVVTPYSYLMQCDHWTELTGKPSWTYYQWLHATPEEHLEGYRILASKLPFDWLEPVWAPSRAERDVVTFEERDGKHFQINTRTGTAWELNEDLPHRAGTANQERRIFDKRDVNELIKVTPAERSISSGHGDYVTAAVETFGKEKFILNGGVTGTFWNCTWYLGMTNLFAAIREEANLVDYLSQKLLEQIIEQIRALAVRGGDGIYIDDAITTNDLISVDDYERFSMPYVREMVKEAQSLGQKVILIYFGGIADRVEQILSLQPDGLLMETSMKGYVNDLESIAAQVKDRTCLFGNIDPVGVVQKSTDEQLLEEIQRQVRIGRSLGSFVISTGSPITPLTSVERTRQLIDIARELGRTEISRHSY